MVYVCVIASMSAIVSVCMYVKLYMYAHVIVQEEEMVFGGRGGR